jgi:hypothetical protein
LSHEDTSIVMGGPSCHPMKPQHPREQQWPTSL